jgi:DNA-binding NarL/FixJ family response regulator
MRIAKLRLREPRRERPIRVLIADDHRILLEALESVLVERGCHVVGVAENGRRAVLLARERHPDVAVLDASMPVMSGLDAAKDILHTMPALGILLVTGYGEDQVVYEALRLGVRGVVMKAQGIQDLLQAIRDVSCGAIYISPCYSRTVLDALARGKRPEAGSLTARETQMLRLIADGKTMKQAAVHLAISVRTAECHRASVMDKLHIHDTAGLVRYAIRQGLVVA